jgi:hypothetical protein
LDKEKLNATTGTEKEAAQLGEDGTAKRFMFVFM